MAWPSFGWRRGWAPPTPRCTSRSATRSFGRATWPRREPPTGWPWSSTPTGNPRNSAWRPMVAWRQPEACYRLGVVLALEVSVLACRPAGGHACRRCRELLQAERDAPARGGDSDHLHLQGLADL